MLKFVMQCVDSFHKKMNLPERIEMPKHINQEMRDVAQALIDVSEDIEEFIKLDMRWTRMHLLIEELGEMCMAMAEGDEIKALDGATDLQYVLSGTCAIFDWPMDEAFSEVHLSNMSKTRKEDDPGRVRDKGETYKPPELEKILARHRSKAKRINQP